MLGAVWGIKAEAAPVSLLVAVRLRSQTQPSLLLLSPHCDPTLLSECPQPNHSTFPRLPSSFCSLSLQSPASSESCDAVEGAWTLIMVLSGTVTLGHCLASPVSILSAVTKDGIHSLQQFLWWRSNVAGCRVFYVSCCVVSTVQIMMSLVF